MRQTFVALRHENHDRHHNTFEYCMKHVARVDNLCAHPASHHTHRMLPLKVSDLMETVRMKAVAAMKAGSMLVLRLGELALEGKADSCHHSDST